MIASAMSSSSSSSSSESSSESHSYSRIPQCPTDKSKFEPFKTRMETALSAKGVLTVTLSPCDAVPHKVKLSDADYKKFLDDCDVKCQRATIARDTALTKTEKANLHKDADVIFQSQLEKCRLATEMIQASLSPAQMAMVSNVFQCNPHEHWRVICESLTAVENATNGQVLLTELADNYKKKDENMREYIARTDSIISKLKRHDSSFSTKMRDQFIIRGLGKDANYNLSTQILMSMNTQQQLTSEKLESHLIAEEQRIEVAQRSKQQTERALSAETDDNSPAHSNSNHVSTNNTSSDGAGRGRWAPTWSWQRKRKWSYASWSW